MSEYRRNIHIEVHSVAPTFGQKLMFALAGLGLLAIMVGLLVFIVLPVLGVLFAIFLGVFCAALTVVLLWMAYIRLRLYWQNRR